MLKVYNAKVRDLINYRMAGTIPSVKHLEDKEGQREDGKLTETETVNSAHFLFCTPTTMTHSICKC
jgi:hypothetical protein